MHIIACIEDPVVNRKILNHLQEKSPLDSGIRIANPRAPDAGKIPGVLGMQNVLNGVSMAVGVVEKALYPSYTARRIERRQRDFRGL